MSKKKISILIYSLASGGAERVVSILLNELKEKFDITLILMNESIFYEMPKEQKILYIEKSRPNENAILKFIKLPFLAYKYKNFCKNNSISLSVSFMNRPNYINILSKFFGNKTKIIINERSMPSLQHKNGIQGWINRLLILFLYPFADQVVANSKGNAKDLIDNFNIKNVKTIYNPIDLEKTDNLKLENVSFNFNKFTFISIGRLDKGKNHKLLINAMKDIDANLIIIGEGILKAKLEKHIETLNLDNRVFLIGKKNNPYKYLVNSNCFVLTSNNEGFPNVILEALACGVPVISTDCKSGPREILAPQSNIYFQLNESIELAEYGILTPINNEYYLKQAMLLILNNKNLIRDYKNKASKRVLTFDKNKIIEKFFDVMECD